ncbi:putative Acid phosphatase [Helianthus annuus]|nr:putative Acid phosphatase [Helianthus annuus]KAJ0647754.1 putative Acid phosphatase [Helianthus annuus]
MQDVDLALKESSSKWKIVVGHHTIFSAGHHGNTQELVDKLLPILLVCMYSIYHEYSYIYIYRKYNVLQGLTYINIHDKKYNVRYYHRTCVIIVPCVIMWSHA